MAGAGGVGGARPSRSEEHTSELQSHSDLHSFPTRPLPIFFGEEGVAARSEVDRIEERRGQVVAGDGAELLRDLGCREGHERKPLDTPGPLELREKWQERVASVELVRADRKSTRLNSSHTVIYTLSLHDLFRSSSAKKALPPDRRWIESRSVEARSWPAMARSCSATSVAVKGTSASRSTRPVRSSSARNGRSGWRRWSSSEQIGRAHV